MADIDGFFAVILWHDFARRGHEKSLETLLAYNIQDVLNLETLMVKAFNQKVSQTPFAERLALTEPPPAINPFSVDAATVARLRGRY